jgi:TM2 domain-containing membrane protein YozV
MFCSKCGKELPEGVKFCPNCGADVNGIPNGDSTAVAVNKDDSKSAVGAGLLGIFLGVFGVHNFYLGYKSKAIVQLILGLTVVFAPISWVWGVIEGIMILLGSINVDGNGKPIKKDL